MRPDQPIVRRAHIPDKIITRTAVAEATTISHLSGLSTVHTVLTSCQYIARLHVPHVPLRGGRVDGSLPSSAPCPFGRPIRFGALILLKSVPPSQLSCTD